MAAIRSCALLMAFMFATLGLLSATPAMIGISLVLAVFIILSYIFDREEDYPE